MDNKQESPCKYCNNAKYDRTINKCYELSCIGYSCFEPVVNTPVDVLDEVDKSHEIYFS